MAILRMHLGSSTQKGEVQLLVPGYNSWKELLVSPPIIMSYLKLNTFVLVSETVAWPGVDLLSTLLIAFELCVPKI